jgi:hypothetical protein
MRFADYSSALLVAVIATFPITKAGADDIGAPNASLARTVCTDVMHIPEGFIPYADCVDSLTRSAARTSGQAASPGPSFPGSDKSYTTSTAGERRAKEERSCASVGQSPGTAAFLGCVTDLDTALQSSMRSE